ncbi:response regulator [Saccharibacillus sacchari]|uniref:response regulator n=1 Tax=Saccharibacillus sacchari TaxID=456493 RepID=UPI0004B49E51|nr:response regulator [Saccharibacillus sacchari]
MLNVLIVDDDKLVRRGLISAMPWAEFGLQVAGEARNGEKALEFLETQEVDLLLTDLAMPVMSGLELMREARVRYPRMFIVVLTLHQDFSYIQEALRLGAIDYIAKVQLEEERFEEVLERICSRIASERRKESSSVVHSCSADQGYAWIAPASSDAEVRALLERLSPALREPDVWAAPKLPAWFAEDAAEARKLEALLNGAPGCPKNSAFLRLHGLQGKNKAEISAQLADYATDEWFYARQPDLYLYDLDLSDRAQQEESETPAGNAEGELAQRTLAELRRRGFKPDWVHELGEFETLLSDLAELRLSPQRLHGEILGWTYAWNAIYEAAMGKRLDMPQAADSWVETVQELHRMRNQLRFALGVQPYSSEVQASVTRAAALVRERLSESLQAGRIAHEVNMSRSYFSQCFRDIMGVTFNEYVRQQRINRACSLLVETRKTVQWVAERTGYADEKYFSRIFREQTGLLPSEYRQQHAFKETNVR